MQPLHLTRSKKREYEAALVDSVRIIRVRATLLTYRGRGTGIGLDLLDWSLDGQSTDPTQPAYVATAIVADPHRKLRVKRRRVWFSQQLRITYGVWLPESEEWVDVERFVGPIVETMRDPSAGALEITAASKDVQHLDPHLFRKPLNARKGSHVHKVIRHGLESRGETGRFRFPHKSRRLNKPRGWPAADPEVQPWVVFTDLAKSIDRRLFYRGSDPVLDRERKAPVWTFRPGKDSILVEAPTQRHSINETYDTVVVKGGKTKTKTDGKKKRVRGRWELKDSHALSSETLTGGDRPRILVIERDKINQQSAAKRKAKDVGKRRAGDLEQEATLVTLPIPHLELGDNVLGIDDRFRKKFEVKTLHMTSTTMELDYQGAPPVRPR